jgi:hypothetical protein
VDKGERSPRECGSQGENKSKESVLSQSSLSLGVASFELLRVENKMVKPEPKPPRWTPKAMLAEPDVLKDTLILESIQVARKNWNGWRDVFEHCGPLASSPLLADPFRFASFCKEYSVSRTIRRGTQNEFRLALAEPPQFGEAIHDDTGHALDKLESDLRRRFGTHDGTRGIVSVLSKVAAFVRPERFVAWDRYAKKGVNIVLGRSASSPFNTYADYLAAFDHAWNGRPGQQIRDCLKRVGARGAVESESRFLRRVLDVYLMKCGGREL